MSAGDIRLAIDPRVLARHPGLAVGGFAAGGLRAAAAALDEARLEALWAGARVTLAAEEVRLEGVAEVPVVREWRQAFAAEGLKPSTYRSSVEALVRRVLKEGQVATPLPVVTAYCAASVRHLAPLGAYDVERLPGREMALREVRPGADRFQPLGGRAEDFPLREGVVAYACGGELLCWSFNHRDSRATCLQAHTEHAVFFGEALAPAPRAALERALEELRALLRSLGATTGRVAFADGGKPELVLPVA